MKLRRALATAGATAVLGPLAPVSAPAAFADRTVPGGVEVRRRKGTEDTTA
ncbi:hypothetical protein [Streptomyces poonensis]|uniref:Uncharacterized protein n=1 Tax=Streptomyces poonensis TaxID=68255 RepID=A0A918P8T0_9ACTN|nr:hypothetical protein [Streptomyces poonensis]GGY92563.1 hypothetical protein GCM10010365_08890 [Streptomyces poonensis]GLJ87673.1 hypothetical protein GCM10017589_02730 [Streptomyces poonensis]